MISWRDGEGALHQGSLFGAFAALARGEAWSFPALRPHQREPWHAFTVQVAALALIRAGLDEPPADEPAWRNLLLALTPDQPEAWELVVDDWSKPALLQPPFLSAADRADYRTSILTPDALDMLVTAKNHDLKAEQMVEASEEDWLFALVTLQTACAYGGARTYGASRMNGKTGSRLIARVRPYGGSAVGFQRDVRLLASSAKSEKDQEALVWLKPTDGREPIGYHTLAPTLYVDCARRVRLRRRGSSLNADYATSDKARVNAEASSGVTGDPYAPIKRERDASITPKRETFGYRGVTKLLKAHLPILAIVHQNDSDKGLTLSFSALVRKGGTDTNTEGFFERVIPTTRMKELQAFGPAEALDQIGNAAAARAKEASAASDKLRYALYALLQGAPSEPGSAKRLAIRLNDKSSDNRARTWIAVFDLRVDRIFFDDAFWKEAADNEKADQNVDHRMPWRIRLRSIAGQVFAEAAEAAPRTAMRRIRAIARAQSLLDAQMTKWLKEVSDG